MRSVTRNVSLLLSSALYNIQLVAIQRHIWNILDTFITNAYNNNVVICLVATLAVGTLVGRMFVGSVFIGAIFVGAIFVGATVVGATFVGATFVGATFVGATFVGAMFFFCASTVCATVFIVWGHLLKNELANFLRSRRQELHFSGRKILPRSSNKGFQPLWTTNSDGADDDGDYPQWAHGKYQVICPAHGLAHELHSNSFPKKGQQTSRKEIQQGSIPNNH
ncbi:unnamed protein product [Clonostachys rosea]|uniref:Uncharacterized protein n=1 Tax=Bionectria ochroleuca TaxID=29856 RepID=A0ABY6U8B6_BIOOC|nr:unnamed protein product [Clonostachys rosea]